MSVERLLSQLRKVKQTGPGKWAACCPAHEDKGPSLAIKDESGTVLIHCFAGCEPVDILGAVGMELKDLFPPRDPTQKYEREPVVYVGGARFTALDALRALSNEGSVVLLLACDMAEGKCLSEAERDRVLISVKRMTAALEFLGENDIERPHIG